jgi:hypothetical protein
MFFLWGVQKVWESMVEFVGVSIGLGLAGKGDKWRGKAGLGLSLLVVGEAVWVWFGEVQAGHGIAVSRCWPFPFLQVRSWTTLAY